MKKRIFILLTLTIILSISTVSAAEDNDTDVTAQIECTEIPFVENQGQTTGEVKYYANTFYGTVYVTNNSITHSIKGANNTTMVIEEQFLDKNGDNIYFQPQGFKKSNAKVDYYIGNDPSKWQTAVETWKTISLGEIYPGIEVILRATGANVEKIFNIKSGANPLDIQIQVFGTDQLEITSNGDLNMQTPVGGVQLSKPIAFQEEKTVTANYQLTNNIYSFQVPEYDQTKTLTIDPTLQYSTCIGGSYGDHAFSIAVDGDGNVYITGWTDSSPDFPTTAGAFQNSNNNDDAFVTKLAPNNHGAADLIYSTFIGGSGEDEGWDIAVDDDGNIYITGTTASTDYPTTTGAYQTGNIGQGNPLVTKLAPNSQGTADLIYSTYIGATSYEYGLGIAVDDDGNIYITGITYSTDFPTTFGAIQTSLSGNHNAFVTKLAPNNQGIADLIYSTYLGGYYDEGWDIAVDGNGNIYITGFGLLVPITTGAFQTTHHGNGDAFVTKLAPNNQGIADLLYSTYIGGTSLDSGHDIAVDDDGNIYITGVTYSTDFPTTFGAFQTSLLGNVDAFVTKLAPNNQGIADLLYSTYIGGTWHEVGYGVTVDGDGNIIITGHTGSVDYPTTSNAYQTSNQGGYDAFVSKLAPNNQGIADLIYSTYMGAGSHDYGQDVAVDDDGNIYITGYTGSTYFPTTSGSFQLTNHGHDDAFISKLGWIETNLVTLDAAGTIGSSVVLTATLTDFNGIPLVSKLVDFYVDGTLVGSDSTNSNGVAVIIHSLTETAGLHTILARFNGDEEYFDSEDTGLLTVNKIITSIVASDATGTIGSNVVLTATLTDSNNNLMANKLVDFYVDGILAGSFNTNFNGVVTLIHSVTETAGLHTILARFNEDQEYMGSQDTGILTVNKIITSIVAGDATGTIGSNVVLTATLTDLNSIPLVSKLVDFYVDGTLVGSDSTNANGQAVIIHAITETAGLHTILARFNEESEYLDSQDTATLTATASNLYVNIESTNSNPTVGDTITITFKVGNNGPNTAEDVVMTLIIPEGLEFVSDDQANCNYDPLTKTVTWTMGDVPVGDPYLSLVVKVNKAGKYIIHPNLSTSTYNPLLQENIATLIVNAQEKNVPKNYAYGKTVGMQKTGSEFGMLVFALFMVLAGLVIPRKK